MLPVHLIRFLLNLKPCDLAYSHLKKLYSFVRLAGKTYTSLYIIFVFLVSVDLCNQYDMYADLTHYKFSQDLDEIIKKSYYQGKRANELLC